MNIVPDWCEIEIDRRLIPGETPDQALDQVRGFVAKRLGTLEGIEFGEPWITLPPLVPRLEPFLAPLSEAVSKATGRKPGVVGVPYGTDAGPLGASGLPCLVFGPGDIAQAHTRDEWVELDQVGQAAEAYYEIAVALG